MTIPDKVPERVALVAQGASIGTYIAEAKRLGNPGKLYDEVWAVNALADVIKHDRLFHMDDVELQERRAEADPDGMIPGLVESLRRHPGPVYTSRVVPGYPGLVEFPLQDVLRTTGYPYYNTTPAYAVGLAIHLGVKHLHVFGCDFSYPNLHKREKGRGCMEWWLGIAAARGMGIHVAADSTLLDSCVPEADRLYGYDGRKPQITTNAEGLYEVDYVDCELPTAAEIELRYSRGDDRPPTEAGQ